MSAIDDLAKAHAEYVIGLREQVRCMARNTVELLEKRGIDPDISAAVSHEIGAPCDTWLLRIEGRTTVQYKICRHGHLYRTQRIKRGSRDRYKQIDLNRLTADDCKYIEECLEKTAK